MVEITLHLDDAAVAALDEMVKLTNKSNDEVVSELLISATKPKRELPKGFGQFSSGQPDLAERTREILFQEAKEKGWR
jgi:hypothetical protein